MTTTLVADRLASVHVNDCAERTAKLTTDFNLTTMHDEEQHQLIFQVVEHHWKLIAVPLKKKF